jgi:hypothetical protein
LLTVHGVVFTGWVVLTVTQPLLVSTGQVRRRWSAAIRHT